MTIKERSEEAKRAYLQGYRAGVEAAARKAEDMVGVGCGANEEACDSCRAFVEAAGAIRSLSPPAAPPVEEGTRPGPKPDWNRCPKCGEPETWASTPKGWRICECKCPAPPSEAPASGRCVCGHIDVVHRGRRRGQVVGGCSIEGCACGEFEPGTKGTP